MEYINKKTGFVMETDSVLVGAWILKTEYSQDISDENETSGEIVEPEKNIQETTESETTGDETYDGITKAQIMQELDAFGVEYDKKATKRVLYDLMIAQGE